MTKEEILAMEAGRELDWEVAKFMKVEKSLFNFAYEAGNYNYPSDLSDAWKVLEQFPIAKVEFVEIFEGNKSYSVMFPLETGDITLSNINSLPLAISKAALLAVME